VAGFGEVSNCVGANEFRAYVASANLSGRQRRALVSAHCAGRSPSRSGFSARRPAIRPHRFFDQPHPRADLYGGHSRDSLRSGSESERCSDSNLRDPPYDERSTGPRIRGPGIGTGELRPADTRHPDLRDRDFGHAGIEVEIGDVLAIVQPAGTSTQDPINTPFWHKLNSEFRYEEGSYYSTTGRRRSSRAAGTSGMRLRSVGVL
jgi:hypothetical protein